MEVFFPKLGISLVLLCHTIPFPSFHPYTGKMQFYFLLSPQLISLEIMDHKFIVQQSCLNYEHHTPRYSHAQSGIPWLKYRAER
jgi:hypothetical protein